MSEKDYFDRAEKLFNPEKIKIFLHRVELPEFPKDERVLMLINLLTLRT